MGERTGLWHKDVPLVVFLCKIEIDLASDCCGLTFVLGKDVVAKVAASLLLLFNGFLERNVEWTFSEVGASYLHIFHSWVYMCFLHRTHNKIWIFP